MRGLIAAFSCTAIIGCGGSGPGSCVGSCSGRVCGDDGCGNSCGSCSPGVQCVSGECPNAIPVAHQLATAMAETFSKFYGFEFELPVQADVSFTINPASTSSPDTWDVAIMTPAEWTSWQSGSGNQATAAVHNNVTSASDTATLPNGDWYLAFQCTNTFENCMIAFDLTATY